MAFYLQASILIFFLAASSAPTPLYPVYQAAWGFSPILVTVVFGVYALSVLGTLLVVGSLSDFVGRRPVFLVSLALQIVAAVVFVRAGSVADLVTARVIQGLSTGAAASALGAGMLDLDRRRGAIASSVTPMMGTATGAILSGLFVQYLPHPTKLVYLVLIGVFVVQAIGVLAMHESAPRKPGALASLRPQLRLPAAARSTLFVAVPAIVGAWALAGFYGSLGPALVQRLSGGGSRALGGVSLFVLAGSGALAAYLTRSQSERRMMTFGNGLLVTGVTVALLAVSRGSLALFFAGTVMGGAGFGGAFPGALRSVIARTAAHERAGVLSVIYVVAYLAMGLPAVAAGARVVYGGGLVSATYELGTTVVLLAALALAGTLRRAEPITAPASLRVPE
ncbi:Major facilitator superfamily protein [Minicystis rosea]|nr:Major facilitator superfamily protein [Minicystis rosea]